MVEVWKPFRSGVYEVSSLGRVRRVKPARGTKAGRLLKPTRRHRDGYWEVSLWAERKSCPFPVHRLVAEAFHGPALPGEHTNHKDGIKTNNVPENLEYVSQAENIAHAIAHNLYVRGDQHPSAKLTAAHVLLIRKLVAFGSQREIGEVFGVGREAIKLIVSRKNWAHV